MAEHEFYGQLAEADVLDLVAHLGDKQPLDVDLTAIAALDSGTAGALATDGSGWVRKTYAQLKAALGLVKGDVGLGNVDNTADTEKPVSTAQQAALDAKQDVSTVAEVIRDTIGTALVEGSGVDITVNDAGDTITIARAHVAPRTQSVSGNATIDCASPGDLDVTATATATLTVSTSGPTPENGRVCVVAVLASGAQRVITLSGPDLPDSGGPTSLALTIPQNKVGMFVLRWTTLLSTDTWWLTNSQVVG